MLLYEDILTGDEMFSDAFPVCASIQPSPSSRCSMLIYRGGFRKLIDDIAYEVDCSMITVKAGADIDIGTVDSRTAFRVWPLIMDRC